MRLQDRKRKVDFNKFKEKRSRTSGDYGRSYKGNATSSRKSESQHVSVLDKVIARNIVAQEDNDREEFDKISRIMTMIVTQLTSDDNSKKPSLVWHALQVTDVDSLLSFSQEQVNVVNGKKGQLLSSPTGSSVNDLEPINPKTSSFREYINFYMTVHGVLKGMTQTYAISTLLLVLAMKFEWKGHAPKKEEHYMSLWQVGWKKYAVASDEHLGMDAHLEKLMGPIAPKTSSKQKPIGWGLFDDYTYKDMQVMSFLPKEVYMPLNDTIAGISQLCQNVKTQYQGALMLDLIGTIRGGIYQNRFVKPWMIKEFQTISRAEGIAMSGSKMKKGN